MTKVGDIELITSSQDLSSLIERCLKEDAYAIDTEFHREKSYYPKLALIQINFGQEIFFLERILLHQLLFINGLMFLRKDLI